MRRRAAQHVELAPAIHVAARRVRDALLAVAPTFVCVHYRQGDKLLASPREYNYTAADVVAILVDQKHVLPDEPMYIATGGSAARRWPPRRLEMPIVRTTDVYPDEQRRVLQPFFDTFRTFTAQDFARELELDDLPTNDYLVSE